MSRLTRDGTAEPVSRDQLLRHVRGQRNIRFPCSADHVQDWQPYPVDPYSAICDDHTYICTYSYSYTYHHDFSLLQQQLTLIFTVVPYFEYCFQKPIAAPLWTPVGAAPLFHTPRSSDN